MYLRLKGTPINLSKMTFVAFYMKLGLRARFNQQPSEKPNLNKCPGAKKPSTKRITHSILKPRTRYDSNVCIIILDIFPYPNARQSHATHRERLKKRDRYLAQTSCNESIYYTVLPIYALLFYLSRKIDHIDRMLTKHVPIQNYQVSAAIDRSGFFTAPIYIYIYVVYGVHTR